MKNTTSIILALFAAFGSLSAQEKQTAKDSSTVMLQDTASGLGMTTSEVPQRQDLTLPPHNIIYLRTIRCDSGWFAFFLQSF